MLFFLTLFPFFPLLIPFFSPPYSLFFPPLFFIFTRLNLKNKKKLQNGGDSEARKNYLQKPFPPPSFIPFSTLFSTLFSILSPTFFFFPDSPFWGFYPFLPLIYFLLLFSPFFKEYFPSISGESLPGDSELLDGPPEAPKRESWMTELPPERKVHWFPQTLLTPFKFVLFFLLSPFKF